MENRRAVLYPHDLNVKGVDQGDGPRPSPASREGDVEVESENPDHPVDRSHISGTISGDIVSRRGARGSWRPTTGTSSWEVIEPGVYSIRPGRHSCDAAKATRDYRA